MKKHAELWSLSREKRMQVLQGTQQLAAIGGLQAIHREHV